MSASRSSTSTSSSSSSQQQSNSQQGPNFKLRARYHELFEKLQKQNQIGARADDVLADTFQEAEKLFKSVENPQDYLLDGKLLTALSRRCREETDAIPATIWQFNTDTFAKRLLMTMQGTEKEPEEHEMVIPGRKSWAGLGARCRHMFKQPPNFTYLSGTLVHDEPAEPVQKTQRRAREKANTTGIPSTQVVEDFEAELHEDQQTEFLVKSTYKQLVKCYRSNGNKPLNYFKFVIDPDSFSASVENVFHVSFLVKEKQVVIFVDEESEIPHIKPFDKNKEAKENRHLNSDSDSQEDTYTQKSLKNQTVITLTAPIWEIMKGKDCLKIERAAINHKQTLAEKHKRTRHEV